jgi:uncharacterized protein YerC
MTKDKVSWGMAWAIVLDSRRLKTIAEEYGLAISTVSKIKRGILHPEAQYALDAYNRSIDVVINRLAEMKK